jgi:hypothetical protein
MRLAMNNNVAKNKRSKMVFDGDHTSDSLMIGNYGDVEILARGSFNLSGMIYSKNTVELTVVGTGNIRFHGYCKKLIIHLVKGECTLDLSKLSSREVLCVSLRDKSKTMIGPTKIITRANVQDEAIFQYSSKPVLQDYSIVGNAKIESIAA